MSSGATGNTSLTTLPCLSWPPWCCCCSRGKTEEDVNAGVATMDAAKDAGRLLSWWQRRSESESAYWCCRHKNEGFLWFRIEKRSQNQPICHRLPPTCRGFFIRAWCSSTCGPSSVDHRWHTWQMFLELTVCSSNAQCEARQLLKWALIHGKMRSPSLSHHSDMCSVD